MRVSFEINGQPVSADIAPRTHLADFLREERLLTGTHLGCEHGVCGACTLLIDGTPARACLAPAASCDGACVETIEGLEDDAIMMALRAAFTGAHALQCGYCTPGMLITARDIVRRLPNADDDRIRLELAGNLCRCTGYNGIVRAIRQVLDARLNVPTIAPTPLPAFAFGALSPIGAPSAAPAMRPERPSVVRIAAQDAPGLNLVLPLTLPSAEVWRALRDPALVAAFIPGATLTAVEGEHISGEMTAALGPIRARFIGTAQITYDDDTRSGRLSGSGQDRSSVTRLSGDARFAVTDVLTGPGCELHLAIDYTLQGPLAQLGRPAIVSAVAAELASQVARNLQARLRGEATPAAHAAGIGFVLRLLWRHVLTRFRPNRD